MEGVFGRCFGGPTPSTSGRASQQTTPQQIAQAHFLSRAAQYGAHSVPLTPSAQHPQRQRRGRQSSVQPLAAAATVAEEVVSDPVQSEKSHIQQLLNRCLLLPPYLLPG